jgi:hypothetical protein
MDELNSLEEMSAPYHLDMNGITWVGTSPEEPYLVLRNKWHTQTLSIEVNDIHFHELMSDDEEEDIFPKKERNPLTTGTPEENNDEVEVTKPNDHPPTSVLEEDKVGKLTPLENYDFEGSQDEDDLPIVLYDENIHRKSGKNAPLFISLLINGSTLHNCMLDSGAYTNIMPLRVKQQLGLEIS